LHHNPKNYLNTLYNYNTTKTFLTSTLSTNLNSLHYITHLLNFLVNKLKTSSSFFKLPFTTYYTLFPFLLLPPNLLTY
ncbi:hypothetical protein, partial [Bacillus sp. WP8]|uniref:hypothetical protein n=1 Tax=Bacillus sp. WP8 TaxID=756828 RepID=UPI001C92E951